MEMAPEEVMVIDIDPAELALVLLSFPSGGLSQGLMNLRGLTYGLFQGWPSCHCQAVYINEKQTPRSEL